jgi:hypothetical protein
MSVAGIGAVGPVGGGGAVYALSPYLNGVVRTPDAVAAAEAATAATAAPAAAVASVADTNAAAAAARAVEIAGSAPAVPFANPAIDDIAAETTVNASLQGDAGLLVQSYGAVALAAGPLAPAPVYIQPLTPAIPPVAPVVRSARAADIPAY